VDGWKNYLIFQKPLKKWVMGEFSLLGHPAMAIGPSQFHWEWSLKTTFWNANWKNPIGGQNHIFWEGNPYNYHLEFWGAKGFSRPRFRGKDRTDFVPVENFAKAGLDQARGLLIYTGNGSAFLGNLRDDYGKWVKANRDDAKNVRQIRVIQGRFIWICRKPGQVQEKPLEKVKQEILSNLEDLGFGFITLLGKASHWFGWGIIIAE